MCGRYTADWDDRAFETTFHVSSPLKHRRYNMAPSQDIPFIALHGGERKAALARWGLVPYWVDHPSNFRALLINARSETAAEKPSFRAAFKRRRCLIPASGFYEWKSGADGKQPYYLHLKDRPLFAFAGLYERWRRDDEQLLSATILTTRPNEVAKDIHNRMPVILHEQDYDVWMDPEFDDKTYLEHLFEPFPSEEMEAYAVAKEVNNARNDHPGLLKRVG